MIWYNGDIHAIYLGGRYHVAAYLGGVLVWRENLRSMQGVEYLMTEAEMGAAAVPAVEMGADAALPSPRVKRAEMVPAAAGAMRVQEAQQLNASCGAESLPASLPKMILPLALAPQVKMAPVGASEAGAAADLGLQPAFSPVSYAVSLMQAVLPPVLRVSNTSLSSAVRLLKVLSMRNRAVLTGTPNAAGTDQMAGEAALKPVSALSAVSAAVEKTGSQAVILSPEAQGGMAPAGASKMAAAEGLAPQTSFSPVSYAVSLTQTAITSALRASSAPSSCTAQLLKILSMRNRAVLTAAPNAAGTGQLAAGQALQPEGALAAVSAAVTKAGSRAVIGAPLLTAGAEASAVQKAGSQAVIAVPMLTGGAQASAVQKAETQAAIGVPRLTGGAQATAAQKAEISAPQDVSLTGSGAVVGASALLAALGVKLTVSCTMEVRPVWEYPVQEEDGTLRITQVYSALQESDGALALDTPVSGKVVKEQDGIAWIIPDGTTKYYKSGGGDGWVVYAERNEVQYIVLENRNEQAVDVRMNGSCMFWVSPEAVAADTHPRAYITVDGVTVVTADDISFNENGGSVEVGVKWGSFKNWQPNTQKIIGLHGGTYHGEYASTTMYPEQATLVILSIRTTEGS